MQNAAARKLTIVIPVYNEYETIESIIKKVQVAHLPNNWSKEIIIVNDGSTDNTQTVLDKLDEGIRIISQEKNKGKGAAVKAGLKVASGDFIIIQDADDEYNPEDFVLMLAPIIQGKTNIVFGSRTMGENSVPLRRLYFYGGLIVTKIFNILFGTKLTDVATCYKVFPRAFVSEILLLPSQDFVFDVIELSYLLAKKGEIIEVPITYNSRGRKAGKKMSWVHGLKCLKKMLAIYSTN